MRTNKERCDAWALVAGESMLGGEMISVKVHCQLNKGHKGNCLLQTGTYPNPATVVWQRGGRGD